MDTEFELTWIPSVGAIVPDSIGDYSPGETATVLQVFPDHVQKQLYALTMLDRAFEEESFIELIGGMIEGMSPLLFPPTQQ